MPAKKPAPKTAKGKKAATFRPAAKKSAATRRPTAEPRGREVERAKVAAAHVHKTAAAPVRASTPTAAAPPTIPPTTETTTQMRKAAHSTSQATSHAAKPPASDSRDDIHVPPAVTASPAAVDADEVEGAEPGSLLAGP